MFLPITKTLRIWKNSQKKIVGYVLFLGYIFVCTEKSYLHQIIIREDIKSYSILLQIKIESLLKYLVLEEFLEYFVLL